MKFLKGVGKFRFACIVLISMLLLLLAAPLLLPDPLFDDPYSTVVYDRNDQLLGARIAQDGQWRFPFSDGIPSKFRECIIMFEDQYFYKHPGFNPVSMFNALMANLRAGKTVRGGSTISMQIIRLSRKGKARTIYEKLVELYLAIGMEMKYSKEEILEKYCGHAPFGGNVVGLDAAAWRFFGHDKLQLSWAEAAMLAVLPNAPALMHPGRNRQALRDKRDRLLQRLLDAGMLDSLTYSLAIIEALPARPKSLPSVAPHLTDYCQLTWQGQLIKTTIDIQLQSRINQLLEGHHHHLSANQIHHAAVLVINPVNKEVLAYVGNTQANKSEQAGHAVDMIRAKRSTGSILKPLLFAAMIEEGQIMPDALIPDIPSYYENYHPQNYSMAFEGAVPASRALSRSLNVPAIYMLRDYGISRFHKLLSRVGIHSFNQPAAHYGLTLILGGGEASLWEICSMYAGLAHTLIHYNKDYGAYPADAFSEPRLNRLNTLPLTASVQQTPLHAASIWVTYEALYKVQRPQTEEGWNYFSSSKKVAWKTGTSYGFKDAWAVGTTADYVVGIWVGNADGTGRAGLVGSKAAAPLLFDIINMLPETKRFNPPYNELVRVAVCRKSGYLASRHCVERDTIMTYEKGRSSVQCPYHKPIFTDSQGAYQLSQQCASISEMKKVSWFILPPVQEWYYRKAHPDYAPLPPFREACQPDESLANMAFIYPVSGTKIYVPLGISGTPQPVIFEISHRKPRQKVYWYIDQTYLGYTEGPHQFAFVPDIGKHQITVTDAAAESCSIWFEVLR